MKAREGYGNFRTLESLGQAISSSSTSQIEIKSGLLSMVHEVRICVCAVRVRVYVYLHMSLV